MIILQLTWGVIQTLIGLLITLFFKVTGKVTHLDKYNGHLVVWLNLKHPWGVSLGWVILLDRRYSQKTVKHEYGHCIQSMIFGPLYLLVIGLPSVMRNIYSRITKKSSEWYYSGYPENWANKLGGV